VLVESFLRVRHAPARGCERGGHALIANGIPGSASFRRWPRRTDPARHRVWNRYGRSRCRRHRSRSRARHRRKPSACLARRRRRRVRRVPRPRGSRPAPAPALGGPGPTRRASRIRYFPGFEHLEYSSSAGVRSGCGSSQPGVRAPVTAKAWSTSVRSWSNQAGRLGGLKELTAAASTPLDEATIGIRFDLPHRRPTLWRPGRS
jgi:hypothetical protein